MGMRLMYALAAATGLWVGTHAQALDNMFPSPPYSQLSQAPSLGDTAGLPLEEPIQGDPR